MSEDTNPAKRMGTRKKPGQFGRVPNHIHNQTSDADTFNDSSMQWKYDMVSERSIKTAPRYKFIVDPITFSII